MLGELIWTEVEIEAKVEVEVEASRLTYYW